MLRGSGRRESAPCSPTMATGWPHNKTTIQHVVHGTTREETAMTVHRRHVLKGLAGAGVGLATLRAPYVHAQAPFKIGLLTVKTGPLAQGGIQMEQGLATLLKEKGN